VQAQAELQELFAAEGFCCDAIKLHERYTCNRALQTTMERHWVQATFTFRGPGEPCGWFTVDCSGTLDSQCAALTASDKWICRAPIAGNAQLQDGPAASAVAGLGTAGAASGADMPNGGVNGCSRSSTTGPSAGSTAPVAEAAAASGYTVQRPSPAAPAMQHEWEAGTTSGVVGSELSDLFSEHVELQVSGDTG
jgi:hypothetical protein